MLRPVKFDKYIPFLIWDQNLPNLLRQILDVRIDSASGAGEPVKFDESYLAGPIS